MRLRRRPFILSITLVGLTAILPAVPEETPLRVVVFTPTTQDNTYWPQVYEIMEAAADDLGVELLFHGFDVRDRYAKADLGTKILQSVGRIDGAIFSVAFGQTLPLLQATESLRIPVIVQGPLFESELPALGYRPRRTFASWVGLFSQDEHEKGRELGRVLIDAALRTGLTSTAGTVPVAGVGGDPSWFGSQVREAGLVAAVQAHPEAVLFQVVPTLWAESDGYEMGRALLARYPDTTVIWAASDQLAIGAARGAREAGLVVGEDLVIGGLDLSRAGLEHVRDGRLTATTASLLFGYARVLVYLTDYVRGVDFADETGTEFVLPVWTATAENAGEFLQLYRAHDEIDYRLLSRALNPELESYDFSPARLRAVSTPGGAGQP